METTSYRIRWGQRPKSPELAESDSGIEGLGGTDAHPQRRVVSGAFTLTIPRQHGAWSVLISSLVLGTAVGGEFGVEGQLLLASAICGFLGRHAGGVYLKLTGTDRRRNKVLGWAAGFTATSLTLGLLLITRYDRWFLLPLGFIVLLFVVMVMLYERRGKDRTTSGELLAIVGLSLAAPAAAYCATGAVAMHILGLWALSAIFFGGSVFHVRHVVRNRREGAGPLAQRLRAGVPSISYHLAGLAAAFCLSATRVLPTLAPLALAPVTTKALWAVARRRQAPVSIRRVGYSELAHTLAFALLTVLAFRASP